jgi:predicted homoserine dehydrogenase-like protein
MIYHHLFERFKKKDVITAGLIGSGHFGTAVVTQSMEIPLLKVPVIADHDLNAARLAYERAGISKENIVECENVQKVLQLMEQGKYIIVNDPMILMELPVDLVVESTGIPEAGARHGLEAINHGKHIAMVTKETDSVVGPLLNHLAQKAGVVYTPVDGDQHGLLMGMIAWARGLGLEIVSAGKARDAEFIYDREKGEIICEADGITVHETRKVKVDKKDAWAFEPISGGKAGACVKARRELLSDLPHAGGFDLCEMVIAANTNGLVPDIPQLHQAVLRIPELPEALCPTAEDGILQNKGVIEVVTCFRHRYEAGLGGGVFMVVACKNDYSRMIVTTKGQIPNAKGTTALIYRPYHLCGVETPITLLCAGILNVSTGSETYLPKYDLVQTAVRDLKAGEIIGNDHDPALQASIIPATKMGKGSAVPAHMLNGNKLKRDVPAGTLLTYDLVAEPKDSVLWKLRRKQEEIFSN